VSLGHTLAEEDSFSVTSSSDISTASNNFAINSDISTPINVTIKTKCQGQKKLDTCLEQLPPILGQAEMIGIPSSKKDVEAACR
jgi:hypothetical protein